MKLPVLLSRDNAKRTRRLALPPAPKPATQPVIPPAPIPLPFRLKHRLAALRRRYRMVHTGTGFFMLAGIVSLLFLTQGLADWWCDLPWLARAAFLLADLAIFATIIRRHLIQPLRKKLGLAETALMVEKMWPTLRQSLISAIEFAEGRPGATRGSRQLVDLVLQEAQSRTTYLDFRKVVPTRALRRAALWGGASTFAALALAAVAWPASIVLLERILLFSVPLPTRTIVVPITRDLTVPLSTDVELSAQAQGVIPMHGRVTISYGEGTPEEFSLTVLPDQPGTFSFTVHNVQRPFKYRFYLNDGHGPEFTVNAKVPPAITTIECTETYPDYTGLPPQKLPSTALTVLAGSHLRISATATESLKSATVVLQGVDRKIDASLDAAGTHLTADIPIPAKNLTGISLHLVDSAGLGSTNDTVYPIDLVPDKPPVVKITEPTAETETITLRAKPVIAFDASDDFGVTTVSFNYELIAPPVAGQETTPPPETRRIPIKAKTNKEGTHYEFVLDVAAQSPAWREGWTVNYWIEAADNNSATGPGVTKSERKQFGILSPQAKEAEILGRIQQNAADLDSLSETQQKVSHDVDDAIPKK